MFMYILITILFIFIFSTLLFLLACISCLGLTEPAKRLIYKFMGSSQYDRQYVQTESNQTLNSECFICLDRIREEVVATCNHGFCADCIVGYIQSKPDGPIDCPACRKTVCVLFRKFNPRTQQQKTLKQKISDYNFKHSQQPNLLRSILQIGTFIRQAPRLLSPQGLRFMLTNPRIKYILLMLIYAASPIDILPEAILGPIGLLDDSVAIMNAVRMFSGMMVNFVGQEARRDRTE